MPPKAAKPPVRGRRTKAEVQQEFEEIQEQVEAARESADAKAEEAARLRETEVRQAVDGVTVEAVVQRISGLGLEVCKALAEISGRLTEEVQLLASLREAVALERKELERLHKIDVAATALDQMVQDYAREKQRLEARDRGCSAPLGRRNRPGVERERKEQEESLKKQRQREIEDYEYKKALERKKAQDKYDEDVRLAGEEERRKAGNPGKGLEAARGRVEGAGGRAGAAARRKPRASRRVSRRKRRRRPSRRARKPKRAWSSRCWGCARTPRARSAWPSCAEDAGRSRRAPAGADRGLGKATGRGQTAGAGYRGKSHRGRERRAGRCRTSTRSPWSRPRTGRRGRRPWRDAVLRGRTARITLGPCARSP